MKKFLVLLPLLSIIILIPTHSPATAQTSVTNSARSAGLIVDITCLQANKCRNLGAYFVAPKNYIIYRACIAGKCRNSRTSVFSTSFRLDRPVSVGQSVRVTVTLRSKKSGKTISKTVLDKVSRVNQ